MRCDNLIDQKLNEISTNVNDWLKFAETKNAVLLTVTGTGFFVCLQIINSNLLLPFLIMLSLWLLSGCLLLSMLFALISFSPEINLPEYLNYRKSKSVSDNDNLLFYAHISKYSYKNYLTKIYYKYSGINKTDFSNFEIDLTCQIIINSKIATRKINLFKWAIAPTISGVSTVLLCLLIVSFQELF